MREASEDGHPKTAGTGRLGAVFVFAVSAVLAQFPSEAVEYSTPPPDLLATLTVGPLQIGSSTTLRVTVRNDGGTSAAAPWVRFYMKWESGLDKQWATLTGATNADCTQNERLVDCRLQQNLGARGSREITVTMNIDDVYPSDGHELHVHVDCGPVASHHGGGLVKESNESNNITVQRVTLHRPPNLTPLGMSSSLQSGSTSYAYKDRDATFGFSIGQVERFVSTGTVDIAVLLPNIDVKSVTAKVLDAGYRNLGSQGFICSWFSDSRKIDCRNGKLGPDSRVYIEAVVRAALFAPKGDSPVIVTADPQKRVYEGNETDNIKTYTVRLN